MVRLNPLDYRIALIAVLEIEAQAALHMLDHRHDGEFPLDRGDDYVFHAGDINGRNVIIATFPAGQNYGTGSAASLASQTKSYFRNLWFGLLVGVAAGLPNHSRNPPVDIRLGDVLVALPKGDSAGLVSYDLGKTTDAGFELLDGGRVLAKTEQVIRSAIGAIKINAPNDSRLFLPFYEAIKDEEHSFEFSKDQTFRDPGQDEDRLYSIGRDGTDHEVRRLKRLDSKRTRVWYGPIGSGDKLMKNSRERDRLRDEYGIIGLEMEAAGILSSLPVGVIRGVCDYGDSHKNKQWQPYAAAMAACYAKAILMKIGQGDEAPLAAAMSGLNVGCEILCDLPSQTDRFFGREAELTGMTQLLQSAESRRGIVLCGISGSGKTQLAREYVSREQEKLSAIVWIDAASAQTVNQSFSQGAERIHLRYPQLHQNSSHISDQSVVLEWLRNLRSRKWLVVIDGMDNPITARSLFQPFDNLLSASGSICITSTNPNAARACRFSQISVEHLGLGPAGSLILWHALGTTEVQDENLKHWAREAARILNRYALGLELAGILVHEGIVRPDTMPPTIFETKYKQLTTIDPRIWNWGKSHTLFGIFDTLYTNLVTKDSVAGDLLTLCSIYGPQKIPIEFLQKLVIERTEDATTIQESWIRLEQLFKDEIKLGLAITKLHEVFLAKKKHGTNQSLLSFSLHGSVCQWRYATIGDQRAQWVVLALQSLTTYLQSKIEHQRKGKSRESEAFDVSRKFHPMATRCLKMLEVDVPGEQLEAPNGVYAKQYYYICSRLAPLLFSCGDYSVASRLFESAITYLRSMQVLNRDEALLPLLRGLARCSQKAGDMKTSEECLESAEEVAVKLYGISSDEAADIYTELKAVRDHIATEADNRKRALVASTGPKMTRQHLELEGNHTTDEHELAPSPGPLDEALGEPEYQSGSEIEMDSDSMADLADHLDARLDPNTRIPELDLLYASVREGNINTVRLLLDRGANPNLAIGDGQNTPLHVASQHGWLEIARLLIERGANVNRTGNNGYTPLHVASINGNIQVVYLLLEKMADLRAKDQYGRTSLHVASFSKGIEILSLLLERGADPNAATDDRITPLYSAAIHGDVDQVRLLIESGANINAVDDEGITPLHCAARLGDDHKVKLLLDRGADPSIKDSTGKTPLTRLITHWSKTVPFPEDVVELLLTAGISCVNAIDDDDGTAVSWAVARNDVRLVQMLLDNHADPTVQDADGNTCLNYACEWNLFEMVETLLDYGVDWKTPNNRAHNALQTAKHFGHDSIVDLLQSRIGPHRIMLTGTTATWAESSTMSSQPKTNSKRLKSWLGRRT